MNEELKACIEKYIEYFETSETLSTKVLDKESILKIYDRLEELDDECRELLPRLKELI